MDYLYYRAQKFQEEIKNKKKIMNETMNNAYTECSEKTAPTYASDALKSRSGKCQNNNFIESGGGKNKIIYTQRENEFNKYQSNRLKKNRNPVQFADNEFFDSKENEKNKFQNSKYEKMYNNSKNFQETRKYIDEFMEEKKNKKLKLNNQGIIVYLTIFSIKIR
jgi:hypothetical protein